MPEKLFNIREVAEYLKLPEEEVKRLVDIGEIPAYKIGDTFLRFRKEQLDAVRSEITAIEKEVKSVPGRAEGAAHPYTDMEKDIKRREPLARQYDYTMAERAKDFFYFNDFYILSFIIVVFLMYLIVKS